MLILSDVGDTLYTLADVIHDSTPLSAPRSYAEQLGVCVGIANGVTHLHDHRIVHGALTPFHIRMGPDGCPKVTDFGLSPLFYYLEQADVRFMRYWSPETLLDATSTTPASDVYSLGLIFHEIFHRQPINAQLTSFESLVESVVHQCQRPAVSSLLMVGIKHLMTQCWAVDVSARPASNRVFVQLMALLGDEPSDDSEAEEAQFQQELARRRSLRRSDPDLDVETREGSESSPSAAMLALPPSMVSWAAEPGLVAAPVDRGASCPVLSSAGVAAQRSFAEDVALLLGKVQSSSVNSLAAELSPVVSPSFAKAGSLASTPPSSLSRRRSLSASDRPLTPLRLPPAYPEPDVLPFLRPTSGTLGRPDTAGAMPQIPPELALNKVPAVQAEEKSDCITALPVGSSGESSGQAPAAIASLSSDSGTGALEEDIDFFAMLKKHQDEKETTAMKWTVQEAIAAGDQPDGVDVDDPDRWATKVEYLLRSKVGMDIFVAYCRTTYCEENALFWMACDKLRTCTEEEVPAHCEQLFHHYFTRGGRSLNIEDASQKKVMAAFAAQHRTRDLFAPAQREIFTLLKFEAYPRFLKSSHLKDARHRYRRTGSAAVGTGKPKTKKTVKGSKSLKECPKKEESKGGASLLWRFRGGGAKRKELAGPSDTNGSPEQLLSSQDAILAAAAPAEGESRRRSMFSRLRPKLTSARRGNAEVIVTAVAEEACSAAEPVPVSQPAPPSPRTARLQSSPAGMDAARTSVAARAGRANQDGMQRLAVPCRAVSLETVQDQGSDLYSTEEEEEEGTKDREEDDQKLTSGQDSRRETNGSTTLQSQVLFRVSLPDHMHNSVVRADEGATVQEALAKLVTKFQLNPAVCSVYAGEALVPWPTPVTAIQQKEVELRLSCRLLIRVHDGPDETVALQPGESMQSLLEAFAASRGLDLQDYTALLEHDDERRFLKLERLATDFVGRRVLLLPCQPIHRSSMELSRVPAEDASLDSSVSFV